MRRGKLETPYVVSYKIKWFAENGWTGRTVTFTPTLAALEMIVTKKQRRV